MDKLAGIQEFAQLNAGPNKNRGQADFNVFSLRGVVFPRYCMLASSPRDMQLPTMCT